MDRILSAFGCGYSSLFQQSGLCEFELGGSFIEMGRREQWRTDKILAFDVTKRD